MVMTEDKTMTPSQMHQKATEHNGRYLLMRRFRKGDSEKDALYDAAQWLVDHGYARWINSNFAPGIELTGKPMES